MPLSEMELTRRLRSYRKDNWKGVQTEKWQEKVVEQQLKCDLNPFFERIEHEFSLTPPYHYLDVGSGIGSYVITALDRGITAFGVEPDRIGVGKNESALRIACDRVGADHTFSSAVGESLPFPDETFDLITMNQVLEHVQNIPRALDEAMRALKPGGILIFSTPNYLSFYEPHYKIFWLPLFPRPLANIYLRLRGRNPEFLQGINYVTRGSLSRELQRLPGTFYDEDRRHLEERIADVSKIRRRHAQYAIRLLNFVGLEKIALWVYLNLFVRGLNFVVRKNAER
jgi:ubiquinone/menaquinone biosynthesis C-methylase UbiE